MKKVKLLALMFLAGATIFTSCKKDETTVAGPTISFANGISSYEISSTATFPWSQTINATVTADGEIKTMTVKKKDANGASSPITITGSYSGKTTFSETFTISCNATDSYPLEIIFSVTDKNDQGMDKTFTITLQSASTPLAYENTSGVIWNAIGANAGGWDLGANAGVSGSSTSADLYNTTVVASPNAWLKEWGSKTGAKFVKVNSYDYTNATVEAANTAYTAGAELTLVTPATGDIYITKIKGGSNYAVIKVGTITETPAPSNGGDNLDKIEFSYKKLTSTTN